MIVFVLIGCVMILTIMACFFRRVNDVVLNTSSDLVSIVVSTLYVGFAGGFVLLMLVCVLLLI